MRPGCSRLIEFEFWVSRLFSPGYSPVISLLLKSVSDAILSLFRLGIAILKLVLNCSYILQG